MRARRRPETRRIAVLAGAGVLAVVSVAGFVFVDTPAGEDTPFVALDEEAAVGTDASGSLDAAAIDHSAASPEDASPDGGVSEPRPDAGSGAEGDSAPAAACAVDDAVLEGADESVVISEVHYHPDGGDEFVELLNWGSAPVDLGGWSVIGFGDCFPAGTVVAPGTWIVVGGPRVSERLGNGGDEVSLATADGTVVDAVSYGDSGQWPAMADGHGESLHRIDPASSPANPGNWSSAPPTPGGPKSDRSWIMPVWSDVSHTVLPEAGEPIEVSGRVGGVPEVRTELAYRIGFGAEIVVPIDVGPDGSFSVSIPGQSAGDLVRYRLVARSSLGAFGTWPRQGDGSTYTGTTVVDPAVERAGVPTVELFIEDADHLAAYNDIAPSNDELFPVVVAVGGEIFDGAGIGTKGRTSLGFPKPKWKVELPPGHRLEVPGVIDHAVDEFSLHATWNDKSALREVLAHEVMQLAGLDVADAFHVQLRRNGEFDGLYTYVEQSDGRWRDRVGLDDAVVYEVGAEAPAFLLADEVELDDEAFAGKYQRESGGSDDSLRQFLVDLAAASDDTDADARRRWMYDNVDIASVVNSLATSALIQHRDFLVKNYRLALVDGRWSMTPSDLDLTWGRSFQSACQSVCDVVEVSDPFVVANTPLLQAFAEDPVLSMMVRTRISTLRDTLLVPDRIERRVAELLAAIGDLADQDRQTWGTFGTSQSIGEAADELVDSFVRPQWERLGRDDAPFGVGEIAVASDASAVEVTVDGVVVTVVNDGVLPVDPGITPIDGVAVPFGVVLVPGGSVDFVDGEVDEWSDPAV